MIFIKLWIQCLIQTLRKICRNTGFLWPAHSRIKNRIFDSVLIWEYKGRRKPVFWRILRNGGIKYRFDYVFWGFSDNVWNYLNTIVEGIIKFKVEKVKRQSKSAFTRSKSIICRRICWQRWKIAYLYIYIAYKNV